MDIRATGAVNTQNLKTTAPKKAEKKEQTAPVSEDKITLGSVAKGTAKVVLGTSLGVVMGAGKAIAKGFTASSKAALAGLDTKAKFQKDGIMKNIIRAGLYAAPAIGAAAALTAGAGPVGIGLAFLAAPGAIGGTAAGVAGTLEGFGKGIKVALNASTKVEGAIAERFGKVIGKVGKFAAGVATGLITAPVGAVLGAFGKSFTYAEKAIGVKKNPENFKEGAGNLLKDATVGTGYVLGALSSSGGAIAVASAAGSGAGAVASTVKGGSAAISGFAEGAKQGWTLAGKTVDSMTGEKK